MKQFIYALLILTFTEGVAQTPQLDKQTQLVQNLPNDTAKIRQLYQLGQLLRNDNLSKELAVYQQAYALAKSLKAATWEPILEGKIGQNWSYVGNADSGLYYLNLAQTHFESQKNELRLADVYLLLRTHYRVNGKYNEALEAGFKALALYEKGQNREGVARANAEIGDILSLQDNNTEALKYAQKAYDFQKNLPQPSADLALTCRNLGDIQLQIIGNASENPEDQRPSLNLQTEGLKLARQLGDKVLIVRLLTGYGNSLKYMEQNDAALAAYQEGFELAQSIGATVFQFSHLSNICHAYSKMGKYRESIELALGVLNYLKSTKSAINTADTYYFLANAYKGLGKSDSVLFYMFERENARDAIVTKESRELQTKYETVQKETKIAQQADELAAQRTRFWTAIGFLAIAIGAGFWLYRLTQQLKKRNEEKEFLIKEIHHRVKNNLQVLSSLLNLQSKHIKDENALDAVREGQNRVEAMGLIHQKLYMGDNLASVEMQDYLKNLGDVLIDSLADEDRINIHYDVKPMHLDVDTAIPLGLIINELVTNSLKYAFPNGREGTVNIALWKNGNGKLNLKVSDDGVGKNAVVDAKQSTSFGTSLVQMLSKKLKGTIETQNTEGGYSTLIAFENFKMSK